MSETVRVDLHCHSTVSDGTLTPAQLADRMAASEVVAASLTDHDSVDGLEEFHQVLSHWGVGFIAGLELTTQWNGREVHLLAYGFDANHPELLATLRSLQQARGPEIQSIAQSVRKMSLRSSNSGQGEPARSAAAAGKLDIADAIALVHRAGGIVLLAHPLHFEGDLGRLEKCLVELKKKGLDGVEALYVPFPEEQRKRLMEMAGRVGLVTSAGTDYHGVGTLLDGGLGTDMPTALWKQFRDALWSRAEFAGNGTTPPAPGHESYRLNRRQFFFHIVFPALAAMALFMVAIFAILLPAMERALLDRKREMIRELTSSAWSMLAETQREEMTGQLTRDQAQKLAKSRIEALRYGKEGKDYFWLQDMHPHMLMHPYRKDLNGQDVSEFRDRRGVRIFVEFADLVRRRSEGYIEYVWQWKDDPTRLVPKESYIRAFEPWGWIIGTGIYIEDVKQEIGQIQRNLVRISLGISGVVALLLLYVMREGLRLERGRSQAEEGLLQSKDRYQALVEATTDGTLMMLEGRCRYANPVMRQMLGYSEQQLELLDLADVLAPEPSNQPVWDNIDRLMHGQEIPGGLEGVLRRRDGETVDCVVALSRISFGGKDGFILQAKDVSVHRGGIWAEATAEQRKQHLGQVADSVTVGLFRARAARRGMILEANQAMVELLRPLHGPSGPASSCLADLFPESADFEEFVRRLHVDGEADCRLHLSGKDARTVNVALRAVLVRDEQKQPQFIDGAIEDVSGDVRREAEREALIEKLQTSLLFLHEPVGQIAHRALVCRLDTPVDRVAALMNDHDASAAIVESESGAILGIVTDHDLRQRIVAPGADASLPIHRIMSAPLLTLSERGAIYEALLIMEEKGVQHLAVLDDSGRVMGMVQSRELLQFHSHGAIVLTREIARASTPEAVIHCCQRTSSLVKSLLDSGAHPRQITRVMASVCDAATERFITLAMAELGPAPASFAFVALGSQGRQERTLCGDQDNAIIYTLPDGVEPAAVAKYFGELGQRVCTWLNQAGYLFCDGQAMASNPRWVQPLAAWERQFAAWIEKAEGQELLEFSIFFDFRVVYGAAELARQLRQQINQVLANCPIFFAHFAQNALLFKPPMRLFGRILGSGGGEHPGQVDLKEAMMPIVGFARLYALRHQLNETHTMDRLDALAKAGVIQDSTRDEITTAYEFLMRLRLRHQAMCMAAGHTPDNLINHRRLGHIEETLLRQSFAQIDAVQKKISHDFLGGM